jgi:hypothetical protein
VPAEKRLEGLSPEELLGAMRHLGPEDRAQQALRDFLATLPAEERLEGLSPEELLRGLKPAHRERLRLLLQQPPPGEGEPSPPK